MLKRNIWAWSLGALGIGILVFMMKIADNLSIGVLISILLLIIAFLLKK